MRTEELRENWHLVGRICGAAQPDVQGDCALPFALGDWAQACGRDGLFLRGWELCRTVVRPEEPAHSHAERTLLTLEGVRGEGELLLDGKVLCALRPHVETDVSEALREGEALLTLRFFPHIPHLYSGEHGRDLPVETGLFAARLRNVYLLRIDRVEAAPEGVRIGLYAYGAGKVRLCLRLLRGEQLLWSENVETHVCVGTQELLRPVPDVGPEGAVLRVRVDMGGEGCDACEAPYLRPGKAVRAAAHVRAIPDEEQLRGLREAGFDGVVLHGYAHEGMRRACAQAGLHLEQAGPEMALHPVLRLGAEQYAAAERSCFCAPLADEEGQLAHAEKLREAVLRTRIAGRQVQVLALGRQRDAQDGLFDASGRPRQALFALKDALGRIAVCAMTERRIYYPFAQFCARILLLCDEPDGEAAVVRAMLTLWDGTEVASRSFAVCADRRVTEAGVLRAQLPWARLDGLALRLQCWKGGRLAAQSHAWYPCAGENGGALDYPRAELETQETDGVRMLCNEGEAAAVGVTVLQSGKPVLCWGVLLPGERVELAREGDVVVKYGNPIRKGGGCSAEQRILRGVFSDHDGAAGDPQAGDR